MKDFSREKQNRDDTQVLTAAKMFPGKCVA
jgi:hypothetical protein